jgi:arsenite oxidase small subunit
MDRRRFITLCSSTLALITTNPAALAQNGAAFKPYARVKLVDKHGKAIKAGRLPKNVCHIFHYPFAGTPCFLINLGKPTASEATLDTADGRHYVWPGGAGPQKSIVAFSAICPHQLSYAGKRESFINYRADTSAVAGRADVIVCCAHHSVFDPAQGGKVIDGPAPQPLATIVLEHDAVTDELYALGTHGGELFEDFFTAFKKELIDDLGRGVARQEVTDTTTVLTITEHSRHQVHC